MEIQTTPHRPATTPWGRLLLLVVVLAPVTVLVLLPLGLGLHRYVMTGDSMAGSLDRGAILFERTVPVSDLRPGDVITYRAPASADEDVMVTHRIVAVGPEGIVTRADAHPSPDPWTLRPDRPTLPRVEFAVPWVGYAYLLLLHPLGWLLAGAAALLLVVLTTRRSRSRREPPAAGGPEASATAEELDGANL